MSEMLEKILSEENIRLAQKKVYSNKGTSGIDGITTQEREEYMKENWNSIKEQIRERKYKPQIWVQTVLLNISTNTALLKSQGRSVH